MFGAAPLNPAVRRFFASINIFLNNVYGMSEVSGAMAITDKKTFTEYSDF